MRKLLIIRHAIAFERDPLRWPDDSERPLTHLGRRKFRCVARELAKLLGKPDQLLTSSLKRARQTARILTQEGGYPKAKRIEQLSPSAETDSLIAVLDAQSARCVAIVGHEPALSTLISVLLAGAGSMVRNRLKKGGIAVLQFDTNIASGKGELFMFIPPRLFKG